MLSAAKSLRRIIAASDLSEDADRSILAGAALARASGAQLHVIHCVVPPVFPYWDGLVPDATRDVWLANARTDLEWRVVRLLGDDPLVPVQEVLFGEPAQQISEYADRVGANLLVVGPHVPRMIFDDLLGTTGDRLIRSASVPCLVANQPINPPLRQILFPVDFSVPSRHCIAVGMDLLADGLLAGEADGEAGVVEILFVHAFAEPQARVLALEPRLSQQVEAARSRLPEQSKVKLLPRILSAPLAVDGIRKAAERMDADLIVLGTHGHGILGRALVGSVASGVARTIPFPVLLVPPP